MFYEYAILAQLYVFNYTKGVTDRKFNYKREIQTEKTTCVFLPLRPYDVGAFPRPPPRRRVSLFLPSSTSKRVFMSININGSKQR